MIEFQLQRSLLNHSNEVIQIDKIKEWGNYINQQELQKRPIIVDADYYKKIFNDYHNKNHYIYGRMAKDLHFAALKLPEIKKVVFTAGGSGSGKSEIILKNLKREEFQGIIVDGTLANYSDALDNIGRSLDAGKQVGIRGIVTDLERAYDFVLQREKLTGRGVPLDTFLERHFNYIEAFPRIINYFENNPNISFIVYDNRSLDMIKIETNKQHILHLFDNLSYDKDHLKAKLIQL